jgi:hypothetical protein
MKATKNEIVTALHDLANWIDRHDIPGESVVMLHVDGWADQEAHLSPSAFCQMGGTIVAGHGVRMVIDGVSVVTCDGRLLDSAAVCEEARAAE